MASVFLSYDREDASKARSIANALEKAGHTVWWDLHVRGGSQFAKAIEEALREADAVVVLWSRLSVDSAWVRDEAAAGRDAGKLVPATIDGTEPPLGFRQYQSIDLGRWRGQSKAAQFKQLMHAVEGLSDGSVDIPPPPPSRSSGKAFKPGLIALIAGVAILAGIALAVWQFAGGTSVPSVTVVAGDRSNLSQALARDLFVKLGRLGANSTDPMEISAEQSGRKADFSLEVTSAVEGPQARAGVALVDRSRTLLWSRDFESPKGKQGDLKQQVALATASVLQCADDAVGNGGLDRQTLKTYLNGCASFAEANIADLDWLTLSRLFREVVGKAPAFDGAWGKLLLAQSFVIASDVLPRGSPEAKQLLKDLATLESQHRDLPESYWARLILLPSHGSLERAVSIAEEGITRHPDSAATQSYYAAILLRTGRMKDAVEAQKRATELDPLSVSLSADYINILAWAGQLDTARLELKNAEALWPGTSSLLDSRWRFALRYGDPKESLRISTANPVYRGFERYLAARIDPTPANVALAITEAKLQVGHDPRAYGYLAQVLAEFGREEDLYALVGGLKDLGDGDVFFRPAFRRFRSDRRFMQVAKRLKLVDYWQRSGKWPDFCFEPDLPYNCKAEAAKLST